MGKEPQAPSQSDEQRRARIEELRRRQRRGERRRTVTFMGVASLVALAFFGRPAFDYVDAQLNDPRDAAITSFGVPMAEAGCGRLINDPTSGYQDHVRVGTRVSYDQVPPSSGRHYSNPVPFSARGFFTAKDRPPVENLVHNLEHGYTILWYDPDIDPGARDQIEDLSIRLRDDADFQQFIASAWDDAYGTLPANKPIALSHWSKNRGHRQLCDRLSGEAVGTFMTTFPASDAPERTIR